MATTTFTGPIRAGNILNTTGTTLSRDVANVGFVVMAQSSPVTQASSATSIASETPTVIMMATCLASHFL